MNDWPHKELQKHNIAAASHKNQTDRYRHAHVGRRWKKPQGERVTRRIRSLIAAYSLSSCGVFFSEDFFLNHPFSRLNTPHTCSCFLVLQNHGSCSSQKRLRGMRGDNCYELLQLKLLFALFMSRQTVTFTSVYSGETITTTTTTTIHCVILVQQWRSSMFRSST